MTVDYKPALGRPVGARIAAIVAMGLVFAGAGVGLDRWALPGGEPMSVRGPVTVIRYVDGVPVGFAATVRGAGDAAAWYEELLAAVGSRPRQEVRRLVTRLVVPAVRGTLVDALMPSAGRDGNAGISQTVVARVWAPGSHDPAVLPVGARVRVQTYVLGLFGAATDGRSAGVDAGLAGGWAVHAMVLTLTDAGWALSQVDSPVPAPGPDVRGAGRDGSERDTSMLAQVLGPDSWVPGMP